MEKDKLIEVNELLHLLSLHGGEIVCTASLDANDINQARASGRLYVDENNTGFVWMPNIMRFPQTDEEVQFFEKWYPLDVEMPDNLVNPDNIINKARKEDELIEKLRKKKSEFECDQAPELSEGTMWLKYDELDLILTSLTAPVPDGKVTDEEIIAEARLYAGSNYSKNHFPDHYENRLTGFIDGAKTICNKLTK